MSLTLMKPFDTEAGAALSLNERYVQPLSRSGIPCVLAAISMTSRSNAFRSVVPSIMKNNPSMIADLAGEPPNIEASRTGRVSTSAKLPAISSIRERSLPVATELAGFPFRANSIRLF